MEALHGSSVPQCIEQRVPEKRIAAIAPSMVRRDMGLFLGRSFRVSFGADGKLITPSRFAPTVTQGSRSGGGVVRHSVTALSINPTPTANAGGATIPTAVAANSAATLYEPLLKAHFEASKVRGWGAYCCDFLLLPVASCCS